MQQTTAAYKQFVSRPELLAFSRRRPGWSFGVFPAIGLLMGVIGLFAALCLLPGLLHLVLPGARIAATALAIKFFTLWLGPVLLSFICAFLAYRYRIPLRWPLLTAVLVCMLGAMIHCQVVFDASRPTPCYSAPRAANAATSGAIVAAWRSWNCCAWMLIWTN